MRDDDRYDYIDDALRPGDPLYVPCQVCSAQHLCYSHTDPYGWGMYDCPACGAKWAVKTIALDGETLRGRRAIVPAG